ncbi:MAG: DUF3011 domain-containing protein [Bdellovibrionota bacterium]
MKNITLSIMMIASGVFCIPNSYAQDFSLNSISSEAARGDHGGGNNNGGGNHNPGNPGSNPGNNPGHGGPGGPPPGNNPGHGGGNDHGGGNPGNNPGNNPGHGGGNDHGGGGGFPGNNPGHGGGNDHGGGGGWPGNPGQPARPAIVSCGSGNYQMNRCFVRGRIFRAELARQYSRAGCIQGRTWGYDSQSIWVNRGCQADFAVYLGF